MKRIAVIPNTGKPEAEKIAGELLSRFPECFPAEEDTVIGADAAVVLGGDGTILRAVRRFGELPILGINCGTLGYMASAEKDNAFQAVERLLAGDYRIEERMMLSVAVIRGGKTVAEDCALNDGVIGRKERILSFSEYFDDRLVYHVSGDGMIVATPTGSTAYSLSAGGPVAPPEMQVLIATPVCPHSIHIRPVIAPASTKITLRLSAEEGNSGILIVDGRQVAELSAEDEVCFGASETKARLIRLDRKNFYDILRYKLSADIGR